MTTALPFSTETEIDEALEHAVAEAVGDTGPPPTMPATAVAFEPDLAALDDAEKPD